MNTKQLKAQRRRSLQKQKKKLKFNPTTLTTENLNISAPITPLTLATATTNWLNKRVQFERMFLDSNGIGLKVITGTIIKVDPADPNDTLMTDITIKLDSGPLSTTSKRIEALLPDDPKTIITSKPIHLLNFSLI